MHYSLLCKLVSLVCLVCLQHTKLFLIRFKFYNNKAIFYTLIGLELCSMRLGNEVMALYIFFLFLSRAIFLQSATKLVETLCPKGRL